MLNNNSKYVSWKSFLLTLLILIPLLFSVGYFTFSQVQIQNKIKIRFIIEELKEIKQDIKEIKKYFFIKK
jgi:Tfp pilus assembly protein PilN